MTDADREHEGRIHAMLDPYQATWDLNQADVAAIRWLLDKAHQYRDELAEARADLRHAWKVWADMRERLKLAAGELNELAAWSKFMERGELPPRPPGLSDGGP